MKKCNPTRAKSGRRAIRLAAACNIKVERWLWQPNPPCGQFAFEARGVAPKYNAICDQAAVGKRIEHQYDPDKVGLDTAVQMLTQRVDNAFETFQHSSVVKKENPAVSQIGIFSKAFAAYQEEGNQNPKWCASTSRITHRFFERNILPTLDALGNTATQADMAELMESWLRKPAKARAAGGTEGLQKGVYRATCSVSTGFWTRCISVTHRLSCFSLI